MGAILQREYRRCEKCGKTMRAFTGEYKIFCNECNEKASIRHTMKYQNVWDKLKDKIYEEVLNDKNSQEAIIVYDSVLKMMRELETKFDI